MIVDSNAEGLILIDERGDRVSDDLFVALMSLLVLRAQEGLL